MNTPCDDYELSYGSDTISAALTEHARTCPRCQATQAVLTAAAVQPLEVLSSSALQDRALTKVNAALTMSPPRRIQGQRLATVKPLKKRFATHAVAAMVGAALAAGLVVSLKPKAIAVSPPAVADARGADVDDALAEEAASFEVSWPDAEEF
jgi:hypothetical protein